MVRVRAVLLAVGWRVMVCEWREVKEEGELRWGEERSAQARGTGLRKGIVRDMGEEVCGWWLLRLEIWGQIRWTLGLVQLCDWSGHRYGDLLL